ncbi:MAG: radical SAM protein [Candidatus Eremiobacteraeota bacterium]|nr:radical SAM protein [Candidatus Eremiobacteraeota bacterium]
MRGVEVIEQTAKSVINAVPGMPFKWSINPYRGCYHQCRFCYARRTHTFLEEDGMRQWGTRIYVKVNAPAVVRAEVSKRSWKHEDVAIGTATDPYQPLEGRYRVTRGILEALRDYRTPGAIITRSPLIVRDIDVLQSLARVAGVRVSVSIATMDEALAREIEPTVAPPRQRLRAVRMLAEAGIDVSVALAPVLPGITDAQEQLEAVVAAARDAGARRIWHNTLNLHDVTRDEFFRYLKEHRPEMIAQYADLYRGKYAPRAISETIDARVHAAYQTAPMRHIDRIVANVPTQLSLI